MKYSITIAITVLLMFSGCSGEAEIISDPNTIVAIEAAAEGAVGLTQLLGALWPALIPIGTAGAGVLAAYKRLKPKIKAATENSDKYFAGGKALATILEDIKLNEPDMWVKIGPEIAKATELSVDIQSTIKGFRGEKWT